MDNFVEKVSTRASAVDSRIVLALDIPTHISDNYIGWCMNLLEMLGGVVAGVKIGLPTLLTIGWRGASKLMNGDYEYFWIADLKLADVGHIGRSLVRGASESGFDAVIVHSMIGLESGLLDFVDEARKRGIAILSLLAMSHPGAEEILNRNFDSCLEASLKADADGFILPATMPHYIRKVRERVKDKLIFSPGIGAQGAAPSSAVSAGADFEIIGRSIYLDEDPLARAHWFRERLRW